MGSSVLLGRFCPGGRLALKQSPHQKLLDAFGPDPEQAELRFAQLRQRLIYFFAARRLPFAEDLADEAIERCARRVSEGAPLQSTVEAFALGIARNLEREQWKRPAPASLPAHLAAPASSPEVSILSQCLDECLQQLSTSERSSILRFYSATGGEKIRQRQLLAAELQVDANALRVRMYRLRQRLESCVRACSGCNETTRGTIQ